MARAALAEVSKVDARMDRHEAVCSERWSEARKSMEDVKTGLGKIFWWILGLVLAVAAGAVSLLITLIIHLSLKAGGL
jgi:hypothetical protein